VAQLTDDVWETCQLMFDDKCRMVSETAACCKVSIMFIELVML